MKVSLNTIRQYIDFDLPPVDELVARINAQLGGVEEVVNLGAKYKGVVIARVEKCYPHPDSDHLHVCEIDAGDAAEYAKFKIQDSRFIQVVCGAPNVREGLTVAWLPPGSTVPASYGTADPFVLGSRNLRGVMSNGMIASAAELAIGDNHDGILEITEADLQGQDVQPGMDFAEIFGLNDVVIDIENKMFTHRPDCFGQLGVAREIAGIFGQQFNDPSWYVEPQEQPVATAPKELGLTVTNEAGDKVPRFMAVAMSGVEVRPSPLWLQCELVRLGSKPINNVVDITNYMMLLSAQPLHAYDYDKLRGQTLGVRMGKAGEKLPLLNGKTYEVTPDDIVIVDGEGPVGMGGVMGGGNSEVSTETKNIVLECATFDMYTIRKTSMRHGLFTDAVTRFNKGQSMLMNPFVVQETVRLLTELSGARQASPSHDDLLEEHGAWRTEPAVKPMLGAREIETRFITERLGLQLTSEEIMALLTNVGFECERTEDSFSYWSPAWRMDIQDPEDVVEEVGRLYGFDKLPRELPTHFMKPAPQNENIEMRRKIGQILSGAGANEVKTYSFVHERLLKNAGQDSEQAFHLSNALSPDLQYYRLSLTPSLLAHVHTNIKAGHDEFALFEFGKAHRKGDVDGDGLPREYERLAFVYAAKKVSHAAYFIARRYLETLAPNLSYVPVTEFDVSEHAIFEQLAVPFDPNRAAVLMDGDHFVGVIGEFTPVTRRAFKLPEGAAGFEVFQSFLRNLRPKAYKPLSRFPYVTQDISLRVAGGTQFAAVFKAADESLEALRNEELSLELSPLDIYQAEGVDTKTITLRLKATNYIRTLTDTEVTAYLDTIASTTATSHHATRQ